MKESASYVIFKISNNVHQYVYEIAKTTCYVDNDYEKAIKIDNEDTAINIRDYLNRRLSDYKYSLMKISIRIEEVSEVVDNGMEF